MVVDQADRCLSGRGRLAYASDLLPEQISSCSEIIVSGYLDTYTRVARVAKFGELVLALLSQQISYLKVLTFGAPIGSSIA